MSGQGPDTEPTTDAQNQPSYPHITPGIFGTAMLPENHQVSARPPAIQPREQAQLPVICIGGSSIHSGTSSSSSSSSQANDTPPETHTGSSADEEGTLGDGESWAGVGPHGSIPSSESGTVDTVIVEDRTRSVDAHGAGDHNREFQYEAVEGGGYKGSSSSYPDAAYFSHQSLEDEGRSREREREREQEQRQRQFPNMGIVGKYQYIYLPVHQHRVEFIFAPPPSIVPEVQSQCQSQSPRSPPFSSGLTPPSPPASLRDSDALMDTFGSIFIFCGVMIGLPVFVFSVLFMVLGAEGFAFAAVGIMLLLCGAFWLFRTRSGEEGGG
ncbi:hypothetical protein BDV06DRAFT_224842 [Aspergillus oleicola]